MEITRNIRLNHVCESDSIAPLRCPKRRIRVLHSVGHLLRGGIETWLYQMIQRLDASHFEHHVLVRTGEKESFTEAYGQAGARVLPCLDYRNPAKYASNLHLVIKQNGPFDILHVHGSNPNGLVALLLAKPLGIPTAIVHSHNDVRPLLESRGLAYRSYVAHYRRCGFWKTYRCNGRRWSS
jgi:glycosyltransferase involved in cell wall biosynthesis